MIVKVEELERMGRSLHVDCHTIPVSSTTVHLLLRPRIPFASEQFETKVAILAPTQNGEITMSPEEFLAITDTIAKKRQMLEHFAILVEDKLIKPLHELYAQVSNQ